MRKTRETGSILIIAIVITILLMGMSTSYVLASRANWQVSESMAMSTRALYISEAGVNQAIAALGVDDTLQVLTGAFAGGNYSVLIEDHDNSGNYKRITGTGFYREEQVMIEVIAGLHPGAPIFNMAGFGDQDVDVTGNMFSDSYDSDCGSYLSQATNYDAASGHTYARPNGSVGSNQDIHARGNADIFGNAQPGPGGTTTVGGRANITGSTDPAVEEKALDPVGYNPPGSAVSFPGGSPTIGTGQYHYDEMKVSGRKVITFTGDVEIWVDGDIQASGQAYFYVSPGANVTIHQDSGKIQLTGQSFVNAASDATSLIIYSATTDSVKFTGNTTFTGAIYAPNASEIKIVGNGEVFGAVVGSELKITGNGDLHYDEALSRVQDAVDYTYQAYSWRQVYR